MFFLLINVGMNESLASANRARLRDLATQFMETLTASADQIPAPMRAVARHLHSEVSF